MGDVCPPDAEGDSSGRVDEPEVRLVAESNVVKLRFEEDEEAVGSRRNCGFVGVVALSELFSESERDEGVREAGEKVVMGDGEAAAE